MKYIFVILFSFFAVHICLPMEPVDTTKWVNDVLLNCKAQKDSSLDSALIIVRKSPKKEYKRALFQFTDVIIKEQTDSKCQKLFFLALMAYNDIGSYKNISYGITYSKYYSSVSKSFCDAYDENANPLYAPLRFTYEAPSFITDSFVLDKSNINDFVENWKAYSSVLKERDKNNIINQKIQVFYQWNEHLNEEAYAENCKELDSLYSTRKRKNRERISDLEDRIQTYLERKKSNVCVLPRTINFCYTSDSFARIKEYRLYPPMPFGGLNIKKIDSLNVIVPYLTEFNHKKVSNEDGGVRMFFMDTHINNILGKYADESDEKHNELMDLFHIYIDSANSFFNASLYPIYYPIITDICCCPDGIIFRARYLSSGFDVFFPNDKNAEIDFFDVWIE
ncbi:MAG: hypothetical protein IK005_09765 [Paludibacteraceae bacterium]|nr:hypothetical protein [Paludibacteraceae bacterium]